MADAPLEAADRICSPAAARPRVSATPPEQTPPASPLPSACSPSAASPGPASRLAFASLSEASQMSVVSSASEPDTGDGAAETRSKLPSLRRLFESEFFDATMAMIHLHRYAEEDDVQEYLTSRMLDFPDADVEFYLPQLVAMYIQRKGARVLRELIIARCRRSVQVALLTLWLLRAEMNNAVHSPDKQRHALYLHDAIMESTPTFPVPTAETLAAVQPHPAAGSRVVVPRSRPPVVTDPAAPPLSSFASSPANRRGLPSTSPTPSVVSLSSAAATSRTHRRTKSDTAHTRSHHRSLSVGQPATGFAEERDEDVGSPPSTSMSYTNLSSLMGRLDTGHAFDWPDLPRTSASASASASASTSTTPPLPEKRDFESTRSLPSTPQHRAEAASADAGAAHAAPLDRAALSAAASAAAAAAPTHRRAAARPPPSDEDGASEVTLAKCVAAEENFVKALSDIGHRLTRFPRELRRQQLYAELALLSLNLPARVYLPLCIGGSYAIGARSGKEKTQSPARVTDHFVCRIPPQEAVTLNSKDKVPFLLHVEVLDCEDCQTSPMPMKLSLSRPRHARHSSIGGSTGSLARLDRDDEVGDASPLDGLQQQHPQEVEGSGEVDSAAAAPPTQPPNGEEPSTIRPGDIRRKLSVVSSGAPDPTVGKKDASARAFKEPWADKVERIRLHSPYGHLPNWRLIPVIVKCGDDLRQELLASQLLAAFQDVFNAERLSLWLRPLRIVVTSTEGGMMEVVGSAISLHQTKLQCSSLLEYFEREFGGPHSESFLTAQRNYTESLAAYSLFCYFVQLKDRHNGNILVDAEGHIIHIDFGYLLSNSPRNLGFESAPFKLTQDMVDVMGGYDSDMFMYFKLLILKGFMAARKHKERFVMIVELMMRDSDLPCFVGGEAALQSFKDRFMEGVVDEQLAIHVEQLISQSFQSMRTLLYDRFQYVTNGLLC